MRSVTIPATIRPCPERFDCDFPGIKSRQKPAKPVTSKLEESYGFAPLAYSVIAFARASSIFDAMGRNWAKPIETPIEPEKEADTKRQRFNMST